MPDKWFTSDTHFYHENIIRFCDRPFQSVGHMNEHILDMWNQHIKPGDKVYHLGDVVMGHPESFKAFWSRLNGKKTLVLGNHDDVKFLLPLVTKVVLWKGFHAEGFTCTHIPQRLEQLRDGTFNVHGHTHNHHMDDPHYINVCVDVCNFKPMHMDDILKEIKRAA